MVFPSLKRRKLKEKSEEGPQLESEVKFLRCVRTWSKHVLVGVSAVRTRAEVKYLFSLKFNSGGMVHVEVHGRGGSSSCSSSSNEVTK